MKAVPPAGMVAAVLGAAALATGTIASFEGYRPTGYKDPAPGAFDSICYGHKQAGTAGKTDTAAQCAALLAQDAVSHGLDIAPCIPADTPTSTRAAFISFAFNVGSGAFCKSTMARKAMARDFKGACAELPKWVTAGGKPLPGLVTRRAAERQLCEQDL